ncbi:MAG: hypothetical protein LBJ95_04205 [Oscillospiraceae bacterium]|nr:hypothetical protein [Oscillospiraceae bacterium]
MSDKESEANLTQLATDTLSDVAGGGINWNEFRAPFQVFVIPAHADFENIRLTAID